MKEVQLYTDGSCSGNPGPGGWGAILRYRGTEKELSGGERETTNNRMELTAAISGLRMLKEPCRVTLFTDSQYLSRAITEGWLGKWKQKGWKKADGGAVLNEDLWQELDELLGAHQVSFVWVKGHADNEHNNRCDALATMQTKNFKESL